MRPVLKIFLAVLFLLYGFPVLSVGKGRFSMASPEKSPPSALYEGFKNPPKEARPRVWWHWMNGNITKDGIYKDLMWMRKAGIVGFHNFDAGLETPQVVEKRLAYMTAEWKDAFSYAVRLADSLGMEVTIASSPGWSETGGPWVKDEDGMKKLVWRQLDMKGGGPVRIVLPTGFSNRGVYQDYSLKSSDISKSFSSGGFYKDIAFLAVKLNENDRPLHEMEAKVSSNSGELELETLVNDSLNDFVTLNPDEEGYCWVQYEFPEPETIKSLIISYAKRDGSPNAVKRELLVSDDGRNFTKVLELGYQGCVEKTYSFPGLKAKYFRLRLSRTEENMPPCPIDISKFILSGVTRVQLAGDKAGNAFYRKMTEEKTPECEGASRLEDVVDISPFVKNGILEWDMPQGRWRIFRFGYSLTGKTNHPATKEATGLEVDKMDPEAVKRYFHNYLLTYMDASGGKLGKGGIEYLLTDSYEAGPQTWTGRMMEEFRRRKGYGLLKWLPALTGMVLNSSEETERFLFDWRMAVGEMFAEYHYDLQNEILAPYGMKRYTESHENFRAFLPDGMDCKRKAEIPMSAFWMQYKQGFIFNSRFEADIRESASVAHIYGQNIAAAESFTSNGLRDGAWVFSPAVLKPTADAALAAGLNRFVIHTSAHQPVDDKIPGLGLGIYGQWFNRHQTWAEKAKVWTDYLSRSCFLLQQGRFVADIAYYYGEDNTATGLFLTQGPDIPIGYNYDYFSPSVLMDAAKAENGLLVAPSGMSYKVLALDQNVKYMSIRVLRRLAEFADSGVVICGAKPLYLAGREGSEEEFRRLYNRIWKSGKKNVISGKPLSDVLRDLSLEPDFDSRSNQDIRFVHRKIDEGEIYWVANLSDSAVKLKASFRVRGKRPVLWYADNAERRIVNYAFRGERTDVDLNMSSHESIFIMFIEDTAVQEFSAVETSSETLALLEGPWNVKFQTGRGAPDSIVLDKLESLSKSQNHGVKYFSGEASYSKTFILPKNLKKGKNFQGRILLDLGEVKDIASVSVNGKFIGTLWYPPYITDITEAVRKGENKLKIEVINMWHNRLVGDIQPGAKKITYTSRPFFKPDEPLLPSGLIGPVYIKAAVD